MKRAQAAMEFMMTYGWAILIVLIAITALAYFGVLSPDRFLPEKCAISTGSGLFCSNFNVGTAAGTVTLLVKNSLTDPVIITANSNIGGAADCTTPGIPSPGIAADAEAPLVFTCPAAFTQGERIKKDISLEYSVGAFIKTTSGQLVSKAP